MGGDIGPAAGRWRAIGPLRLRSFHRCGNLLQDGQNFFSHSEFQGQDNHVATRIRLNVKFLKQSSITIECGGLAAKNNRVAAGEWTT